MNRELGYEPYEGFEIYAFPAKGKDIIDRPFDGYRGWAKRPSDGKTLNGGTVHRTIPDAEDEMRSLIDAVLTFERKEGKGDVSSNTTHIRIF